MTGEMTATNVMAADGAATEETAADVTADDGSEGVATGKMAADVTEVHTTEVEERRQERWTPEMETRKR